MSNLQDPPSYCANIAIEPEFLRTSHGRHGAFTHLIADTHIGDCLAFYGEWAEAEVSLFEKIVRPRQTVLEAGANIGTHTVPLAKMVGIEGRIYAFEPSDINYQLLRANLQQNACANVETYQCVVGDAEAVVEFPALPIGQVDNFGAVGLYTPGVRMVACPAITVDSLDLDRLDFLKVDVEGHEREVLLGALKTIHRTRPLLFVESLNHHALTLAQDGHASWLMNLLKPLGYRFWHYITPLFNSQNFNGVLDDHYAGQWSFDMLCIPAERGHMTGLQNAETEPLHCDDPDQWRGARFHPA